MLDNQIMRFNGRKMPNSFVEITSWALAMAKPGSFKKLKTNFPLSWPLKDRRDRVSSSIENVGEDEGTSETLWTTGGTEDFSESPTFLKWRLLLWRLPPNAVKHHQKVLDQRSEGISYWDWSGCHNPSLCQHTPKFFLDDLCSDFSNPEELSLKEKEIGV